MTNSWLRLWTFLGLWIADARGHSSEQSDRLSSFDIGNGVTSNRFKYQQGSNNSQDSTTRLKTPLEIFPGGSIRNLTVIDRLRKSDFVDSGFVGNPEVKPAFAEDELVGTNIALLANGKNVTGMMRRIAKNDDSECHAIYSCLDCFTARLCRPTGDGGFEEVLTVKCPPTAPHCDSETGTCMYRTDPMCMEPDDFVCLSDGHFPDVNCKFYHVCTNLTSEKRHCDDPNEYYNAERGSCDVQTRECGFFDCYQQAAGVKTPFTTAPNYFAYCGGNKRAIFIDKCPDGTWLNSTTQRCEPMCFHREGLILDPTDCSKYYKCHKLWLTQSSWRMIKERKSCPPGTGFSSEEFSCVGLGHFSPPCGPYNRRRMQSGSMSKIRSMLDEKLVNRLFDTLPENMKTPL